MAENVDTAFATLYFTPQINRMLITRAFQAKLDQMFLAWSHVDLWVNALRHEKFSGMTRRDHAFTVKVINHLLKEGAKDTKFLVTIAAYKAWDSWYGQSFNIKIPEHLWNRQLQELFEFYEALPREPTLQNLVESVQGSARILQFSINPRIEMGESGSLWTF